MEGNREICDAITVSRNPGSSENDVAVHPADAVVEMK
jgi:hypothetical protein